MNALLEDVKKYWSKRAGEYCMVNENELNSFKKSAWIELIHQYAREGIKEPLKVLDAGTGPGFFALIMAETGHVVSAIDCTDAMLDKARKNASKYNRKIHFEKMDVQELRFEDNTFDLIITRNLIWNLEKPESAFSEFYRVLNYGGRLINFDANWYLHLHDSEKREAYNQDRINAKKRNYSDHYTCTDTREMERIAKELPLSRTLRPEWDTGMLTSAGFKKIFIELDIKDRVWDEEEKVNYRSTPMFMVCAEK